MKIFGEKYFTSLEERAQASPRRRMHVNVHADYSDSCQRLFNAIGEDSYIRPHRHAECGKWEMLIAIRGVMALIIFTDEGNVAEVLPFGSEKHGQDIAIGVEIPPASWHSVIAFETSCILLEVKAGPFDPSRAKELAPWAPPEGSEMAANYLDSLRKEVAPRIRTVA